MNKESIYTVGGTVQAGSGIYIERNADSELMKACREGAFAYILTARQMGKSSLMVNTARRLVEEDVHSVIMDLTELGVQASVREWYLGLMVRIASRLGLNVNLLQWWQEHADVGVTQRLSLFFQELVLPNVEGRLVVFIDEIDSTLSLDFTDDFFAAVRYLYNARSTAPELKRLSFVLIGVARPSDLIDDPKRTPFNIGRRIDLTDFTAEEAAPLAQGLPGDGADGAQQAGTLEEVLAWTGGHPYLTQRLCHELAERNGAGLPVDAVVADIFLGENSYKDNNLQFVHEMLTRRAPVGYEQEVLATYQAIRLGRRPVRDEEQSLAKSHLKLSGVVKRAGRDLAVRNRIYERVFDRGWIREQWPVTWWDLIPTEVKVAAGVSLLLLFGLVAATLFAFSQQRQAQALAEDLADEVALRSEAEAEALSSAELAATRELEAVQSAERAATREEAALAAEATAEAEAQVRSTAEAQAVAARGQAEDQARLAQARELAAHAQNQLETDPERSLLLARRSLELTYTADAEGVLRRALQQSRVVLRIAPDIHPERNGVTALYGPSGEFIATHSTAGRQDVRTQTQIWDAGSGRLLFTVPGSEATFSADGRRLATTAVTSDTIMVHTWQLPDGQAGDTMTLSIAQPGFHGDTRLSADFSLLAAVISDTLAIADLESGVWRHNLETGATILYFQFSPDAQQVATNAAGNRVLIWDTESGELQQALPAQDFDVNPLAFSPDGARLVTHTFRSNEVKVWDVATGELLFSLAAPNVVNDAAFSPDGSRLATGLLDGPITIRDAATGAELLTLRGHQGGIHSLDFAPDGRRLLSGSADGSARIWDVTSGGHGEVLTVSGNPFASMDYAPGVGLLAGASEDGTIWVWDAQTGERLRRLAGHEGAVWGVDVHPEGTLIASAGEDSTARLWDAETGELLLAVEASDPAAKPNFYLLPGLLHAQFSPDGERLATGGADGVVRVWDVPASLAAGEGQLLWSGEGGIDGIIDVVFSEDGEWLVTSVDATVTTIDTNTTTEATAVIWDAQTGGRLITLASPNAYRMHELALSSDRHLLATPHTDDGALDVWSVETGEILYTLTDVPRILPMDFNTAGTLLATGHNDGTVRVWDLKTRTAIATLGGFEAFLTDLEFAPDGRRVVASSVDGTVRIFTLDRQELLAIAAERATRELTEAECRQFLHNSECRVLASD